VEGAGQGEDPLPQEVDGERIVGGINAALGEFPYIISLQIWEGGHICGGSIYDEQTVVTAAHCIDGMSESRLSNLQVVAGERELYSTQGTEQRIKVDRILTINYNSQTFENDIAVLHLESPFTFNQYVKPISPCSSAYSGAVTVAGWGNTEEGGSNQLGQLYKVHMLTVPDNKCGWVYGSWFKDDSMMCAGVDAGGQGSCQGDSGGPLVTGKGTETDVCQLGVVSFGYGCGRPRKPTVYAKVSEYVSWLSENAAGEDNASAISTPAAPASDGKCMGKEGGQCQFWADWGADCNYWKDRGYSAYWCYTSDYEWDECDQSDIDCPF